MLRLLKTIHVMPINDLIQHDFSIDCVCGPHIEAITKHDGSVRYLITHHSLDGREQHEQSCQ